MRYKQTIEDLSQHWSDHLEFLITSCDSFDKWRESEAKRIAVTLRVLFHNTTNSHSLFNQLKLNNNFLFLSTSDLYTPSNLLSSWTLISIGFNGESIEYKPLGYRKENPNLLMGFDDWWNQIVFADKENVYSRKDIVKFVANQDGGAHIDPGLDKKYAALTKHNSLGWITDQGTPPKNNPVYNAIRQIADEVLISQNISRESYTRKRDKQNQIEFRFFDNCRRYMWSSTLITTSEETLEIVNKHKKEERKLYWYEYKNGNKFRVISK